MNDLMVWGTVVLLLAPGAYLTVIEQALTRVDVVRALHLAEGDVYGAKALLWLLERRTKAIETVVACAVLLRVCLVTMVVVAVVLPPAGFAAVVLALALVVFMVVEVVPRTLVRRREETVALRVAPSARLLVRILRPVVSPVARFSRLLVPRPDEPATTESSEDADVAAGKESDGAAETDEELDNEFEATERAMIRSILDLGDTIAREVMTPRPDMCTIPADATVPEVVEMILANGFSRLPVTRPDDGRVVGVVHAKDVLRQVAAGNRAWDPLVREPLFVPETKRCDQLLQQMRAAAVHLALVVDEYGELAGLVTIEDLIEEIVGEIIDEHDQEEPPVVDLGDGQLRIDARMGVDDLNERLGTQLPEQGWDTVGGLVLGVLGRVPVVGEQLELDGTSFTVEQVQGRRVLSVRVEVNADRAGAE